MEYLDEDIDQDIDQDIDGIIQMDEHSAAYLNMKNAKTKDNNDKENTLTNNAACNNSNENSNDSYSASTPIIKKRKRKSHSEKVQSTQQPTQNLTNIAHKTYEIQSSYYENKLLLKKRELELKERFVNATEKCNPS